MKEKLALLLSLVMILSATACNDNSKESVESTPTEIVSNVTPIQLTNKMTPKELERVSKHGLTLLDKPDKPEETVSPEINGENTEHTVSVEFMTYPIEQLRLDIDEINNMLEEKPEAVYSFEMYEIEKMKACIEAGEDYKRPMYILVDGKICSEYVPSIYNGYDGGAFSISISSINENDELVYETLSFTDFEEYLDWLRETYTASEYPEDFIERYIMRVQIANEALKTGDYEILPEGTIDLSDDSLYDKLTKEDYRDNWEYDREAVEAIKDSIDEINIYDEEMDIEFLVHVTLPPNYDKNKTYPVYFLTDGVWRFGNHPQLRKVMENGEASEIILVSLGYNYDTDGADTNWRYNCMVIYRDKLLDFITDNLMPYLGENYNIDYENSTIYGHSDGGVFTHNALFKSDLYENQPFGRYIIGSPAFWGLYLHPDLNSEGYENDYEYFERNEKLDKSVFLCAGALEDPDYADRYNGHDTTLEGIAKLNERLKSHGANVIYKLYDSHHYQFIPDMLIEYLKEEYPN